MKASVMLEHDSQWVSWHLLPCTSIHLCLCLCSNPPISFFDSSVVFPNFHFSTLSTLFLFLLFQSPFSHSCSSTQPFLHFRYIILSPFSHSSILPFHSHLSFQLHYFIPISHFNYIISFPFFRWAVILAFDVRVERDAQEMADSLGVKIFVADIIYHLFDNFLKHRAVGV